MAKRKEDSGDWDMNPGIETMSIKQRIDTQLGVTSPEVVRAMEAEEAFLRGIKGKVGDGPFTDRRPIPGRTRMIP